MKVQRRRCSIYIHNYREEGVKKTPLVIVFLSVGLAAVPCHAQVNWLETSMVDFSDGAYERNLYASHRTGGAVEFVPRFDLNSDGFMDILASRPSDVVVFWGSDSGYFPVSRLELFAPDYCGNCDIADLNTDGYADLVVNRMGTNLVIYWGSSSGLDPGNTSYIEKPGGQGEACFIADFNKDGHLDIALEMFGPASGCVLWGESFDPSLRTDLPNEVGGHNIEVADLDKNGWLDILFVGRPQFAFTDRIFWGGPDGFSEINYSDLPACNATQGLSVADLDGDDFLDVVTTAWEDPRSFVYWGSDSGYSTGAAQVLNPGQCHGGSSVCDMNGDGLVDIIYHHGGGGPAPQVIYWNDSTGFSDGNKTLAGQLTEVSGGYVADLDRDGNMDIFLNGEAYGTYILWGPYFTAETRLSLDFDRHGTFREIGNVYDRGYSEIYVSSVFDAGSTVDWPNVTWVDSVPDGAAIGLQVRSGGTSAPDPSWSGWVAVSKGEDIGDSLNARYLQYRALFTYTCPTKLPILLEVSVGGLGTSEGLRPERLQRTLQLRKIGSNPAGEFAELSYVLPVPSRVALEVFNADGRRVCVLVDEFKGKGIHYVAWPTRSVPSGTYFCRLEADNRTRVTKLLVVH
jgi:hypothetical protein